jgi:hypothetical protein
MKILSDLITSIANKLHQDNVVTMRNSDGDCIEFTFDSAKDKEEWLDYLEKDNSHYQEMIDAMNSYGHDE